MAQAAAAAPPPDKKRKVINSEGREIIAKVYHFLRDEYKFMKDNNFDKCDLSPLSNVRKRTAEATGVSESTVTAILKEERQLHLTGGRFVRPMSRRRPRHAKHRLDAAAVRALVTSYRAEHQQMPTLSKLAALLKASHGYTGCLNTLRTFLIKMGYSWDKTGKQRKVLHERIKADKRVVSHPQHKLTAEHNTTSKNVIAADATKHENMTF